MVLAWLPALGWAGLIWILGTDDFSAIRTSSVLGPLVAWLLPDVDPATRFRIVMGLRKLAHPTVYGVLAGLSWHGAGPTVGAGRVAARAALALVPVALLASADEWRQTGSRVRTGAASDVLLDMAGALAVVAAATAWTRWRGSDRRVRPAEAPPSTPV